LKSAKYPLRVPPSDGAEALGEDNEDREAFCRLSAQTVSELIQEEPDIYMIKDIKVRYR
jgi:hypothetical protein